jgi:hypothetical protein
MNSRNPPIRRPDAFSRRYSAMHHGRKVKYRARGVMVVIQKRSWLVNLAPTLRANPKGSLPSLVSIRLLHARSVAGLSFFFVIEFHRAQGSKTKFKPQWAKSRTGFLYGGLAGSDDNLTIGAKTERTARSKKG